MSDSQNIVWIVADSLRYDTVEREGLAVTPYMRDNATRFTQARSSGCWTLPATASMFTGLVPHEHGATSQTRSVLDEHTVLAERLQDMGYKTIQITANPVTTHIFGLDRGFDEVVRIWDTIPYRGSLLDTMLVLASKSRVRRELLTRTEDFVMGQMSDDVKAARAWIQSNAQDQFRQAKEAIEEYNAQGHPVFVFVNVMEAHFPYHVEDTLRMLKNSMLGQLEELWALFHFVNQTRLMTEGEPISERMLEHIRRRQQVAWARLAPQVDDFAREMHEDTGDLVIFCSDHGDVFGEQDWQYHFSNVSDGGNQTPLYIMEPGQTESKVVEEQISMRHLHDTVLKKVGVGDDDLIDLTVDAERSHPVLESYWYNRDGKTLDRYRFNQFAFTHSDQKYVRRNDEWLHGRIANGIPEKDFSPLDKGVNPIEEIDFDNDEERSFLRKQHDDFEVYSNAVLEDA